MQQIEWQKLILNTIVNRLELVKLTNRETGGNKGPGEMTELCTVWTGLIKDSHV